MKAVLIIPDAQTIESIEINSQADVVKLIGFDTVTSAELGPGGGIVCTSTRIASCVAPLAVFKSIQ